LFFPQTSPSPSEPLEQQRKKRKRIVQLKRFIRRVENSLHHQDDQV